MFTTFVGKGLSNVTFENAVRTSSGEGKEKIKVTIDAFMALFHRSLILMDDKSYIIFTFIHRSCVNVWEQKIPRKSLSCVSALISYLIPRHHQKSIATCWRSSGNGGSDVWLEMGVMKKWPLTCTRLWQPGEFYYSVTRSCRSGNICKMFIMNCATDAQYNKVFFYRYNLSLRKWSWNVSFIIQWAN